MYLRKTNDMKQRKKIQFFLKEKKIRAYNHASSRKEYLI